MILYHQIMGDQKYVPKELLSKVRRKTLIERLGEDAEELVIHSIVNGKTIPQVIEILSKKYPQEDITYGKIQAYIKKNREVARLVSKIDWEIAKQKAKLQINYEKKLYDVIVMAEQKLTSIKDTVGCESAFFSGVKTIVGALKTHATMFGGQMNSPSPSVNISIVNKISSDQQDLRTKVLRAPVVVPDMPVANTIEIEA